MSVVTIGNFDGVHLGHRALIRKTLDEAERLGAPSVALTFRPHPQIALHPEKKTPLLLTYDEKVKLLQDLGIGRVVEQPFSREFSQLSPERFLGTTVIQNLQAQSVIVGYDFRFGSDRAGGLDELRKLGAKAGIRIEVVPPQKQDDAVVSSSRIRAFLLSGQIAEAAALLGYSFFYEGVVNRGDGRGRKMGVPTANIVSDPDKLQLPHAIYATRTHVLRSNAYQTVKSVTSIGVRPTFAPASGGVNPVWVETNLFDFDQDLYGTRIRVEFVQKIRDERKFDGIEPLIAQMHQDIAAAKEILSRS